MRVLIGVDDSRHSEAALELVRRMVWPPNTTIVVLSAVSPAIPAYAEMYSPAVIVEQSLDQAMARHLEIAEAAEARLRERALATSVRVVACDPRVAIVEAAHSERADLVVVGSHGRTGLARLLLGSVASHVVSHAPCSVLVVKLPAR